MAIIGIDLGGSHLRAALARPGGGAPVLWKARLDRLLLNDSRGAPGRAGSLKRHLDSDRLIRVGERKIKSVDYVVDLLKTVRLEHARGMDEGTIRCVMAVPSCYSQRQRSTLREVAIRAGFTQVRLVDDTLAILLASGKVATVCGSVLIYSWGASVFCTALYDVRDGRFQPVAQDGDRETGGEDVENRGLESILPASAGQTDIPFPPMSAAAFEEMVIRGWKELSWPDGVTDPSSDLPSGPEPVDHRDVTGWVFREELISRIPGTLARVDNVLSSVPGKSPDRVLLAGGLAHIPAVSEALAKHLGLLGPVPTMESVGDDAVALGAISYGKLLPDSEWEVTDSAGPVVAAVPVSPSRDGPALRHGPGPEPNPVRWADEFRPLLDAAQRNLEGSRLDEALGAFDKIFARLLSYSGEVSRRAADAANPVDAVAILQQANRRDPSNRRVAVDLARVCYTVGFAAHEEGQHSAAHKIVREGIRVLDALPDSETREGLDLARLLYLEGCVLWRRGDLAEALHLIQRCARIDPGAYEEDLARLREACSAAAPARTVQARSMSAGRNDPCPCGSTLKYKKCHGRP